MRKPSYRRAIRCTWRRSPGISPRHWPSRRCRPARTSRRREGADQDLEASSGRRARTSRRREGADKDLGERMKVAIAGAGAVGRSIARELVETHEVTLLERNPDHIDVDAIPAAHWRLGDACELSLLESVQLHEFDVVIAATGDDKVNVVLSLLAKTEFAVPRVVARVNDPRNEWLFDENWGVDVAVSTPRMLASLVEEAVAVGDLVRLMEFRKGQANLVEITLPDDTPWGGKPVKRLELPRDATLVTILRGPRVIVPERDEPLEGGDELVFVAISEVEEQLQALLLHAQSR